MSARLRVLAIPLLLCVACSSKPTAEGENAEAKAEGEKAEAKGDESKADETKADETKADETKADEPAPAGETKRIEVASETPPAITVLETGTDPAQLRLKPAAGTSESMKMTMQMSMKMGPSAPAIDMPPIVTSMSSVVDEVTDDRIAATMKFESMTVEADADTPAAMVEQLQQSLSAFESFQSNLQLDRRGALLGGTIDMPQGLPAPAQQMMNQTQESFGKLQVPLPEEAVGVGGKWKAVSDVDQGGVHLQQTAIYEVLEREGDTVKLKVELDQKVTDPSFSPPGMAGVKGKIERYEGGGSGELELALDRLTPTKSHMAVEVDMKMTVSMMGQDQVQEMVMKIDIGLERGE